uniref:Uncharacterized protein n=1 Tax=Cacopsylla melanoneura TaxID=428564 RepID=A0A8D9E860_9HEMI
MADRLSDFTHEFIKFPTNDELREVHTKFFNMRGFPGVSGVIDIPMWKSKALGVKMQRCFVTGKVISLSMYNMLLDQTWNFMMWCVDGLDQLMIPESSTVVM